MIAVTGIPLGGMVTDEQGANIRPGTSPFMRNAWRDQGVISPRCGLTTFANTPATDPVQKIVTMQLADGTTQLVRIDENDAYRYNEGTDQWDSLSATFGGTSITPFSVTMSNNELIITNGAKIAGGSDGIWRWTGSGNAAQIAASGLYTGDDSGWKYVTYFLTRVVAAYSKDTTSGAMRVIMSGTGSNTDWTSGNGAFLYVRNDHPSPITGLSVLDGQLVIWKKNAVIFGVPTGDAVEPLVWRTVRTEGIGLLAPQSLASYGGVQAGLSNEGFFVLQGGNIQFIDKDIKRDIFRRINWEATDYIHALVMPEYNKAVWFVPEDSATYPQAAWIYDFVTQGWDRWDFSGIYISTAARVTIATGNVINTFSSSPGDLINGGTYSSAIINTMGSTANEPIYLFGDSAGVTHLFVPGAATPQDGTQPITFVMETPDVRWEGEQDPGTQRTVGPRDMVTLDEVELLYSHSGADEDVTCTVSTDGGASYQTYQTKTLTSTSGLYTRAFFHGRITGRQVRVRFEIASVAGAPKFRNVTLIGRLAGERR